MPITHAKVNNAVDDGVSEVQPSHWNADHYFSLAKSDVGLTNVDNTSDAGKPVSSAQQTALDLKANTADILTLASGVYTPSITAEANLDATTTITEAQYIRVGSVVTVSGRFTANATLTATATSFEIDLPIASNIGALEDVAGTAVCGTIYGLVAAILGSVTNNTAVIRWISSDINAASYSYHFTYQVI